MILHFLLFLFRIALSESVSRVIVLQAVVGKLFQINGSTVSEFRGSANLPDWVCNSSSKYRGIPTTNNVAVTMINEQLVLDVKDKLTFDRCVHRWPTIMVLLTDSNISAISGCERLRLWDLLQHYFPGKMKNIRLVENVPLLMRSLSILAQWKPHQGKFEYHIRSAIVSHIGCGIIPESMIDDLKNLEKEDNVNKLSKVLSLPIRGWLIADHLDPVIIRNRRHSKNGYLRYSEYSSVFYRHERQQKQEWNEARIIIEGSGLFDENLPPAIIDDRQMYIANKTTTDTTRTKEKPEKPKVYRSNTTPVVKKNLDNISVFVGFKRFYQILPQTFFDEEDGYSRQLMIKVYLRSKETGRDELIDLNTNQWIYFLQEQQVVSVQPRKSNVGQHDLTVCAYDSDKNRICDSMKIFIKNQKPITKNSHIIASAGVVWKYPMPRNWAEEVKYNINDSVVVKVKSSSLIAWYENSSMMSLITEAFLSKEHKIKMIAESQMTGKTLVWTIIVTTPSLNPYSEVTSPEIVLKLTFPRNETVPLDFINTLKERLISAIASQSTKTSSSSRDILLYRIINGREVFIANSTVDTLVLSFVYSPKKSQFHPAIPLNCSEVAISKELLDNMKSAIIKNSKNWILKMISLITIQGKCVFDGNHPKSPTTSKTIPPDQDDGNISQMLNQTINLAVKNGFTFKKIIVFPFQTVSKLIRSMQLLDSSNLPIDDSSWVSLCNKEHAIYGLPLLENVRRQPYIFNLKVTFQSGSIQLIIVNIIVEKFVPNFNHKFGLIISISEKDTVELSRTEIQLNGNSLKTMGQLLVSQTFSYRWLFVDTLARYLNGDQCISDCGMNIFIYSFSEPKTWQINVSWSIVVKSPNSPEYPTIYSVASCSDAKLKSYIRSLMHSDHVSESIIALFSSSISTFQARPHQSLAKVFQRKYLGAPVWVTVESSGPCSDQSVTDSSGVILSSDISVNQGSIFAQPLDTKRTLKSKNLPTVRNLKIYFLNGSVCELDWFQLSQDGRIIYGLPLLSDVIVQSYFSLRILLEFGRMKEKLNYYISISLKPFRPLASNNHIVNMTILVKQVKPKPFDDLDYKIQLVRTINGYLNPSCTLGNKSAMVTDFQFLTKDLYQRKYSQFCDKAEDVFLHALHKRTDDDNIIVDVIWSQASVLSVDDGAAATATTTADAANAADCNVVALQYLSGTIFHNYTSRGINQELISFFDNSNIGKIIDVQLHLSRQCLKSVIQEKIDIPYAQNPTDISSKRRLVSSQTSTKIVLGVLGFLTVVTICVCIVVYFIKRGLPSSFSRLTDKSSKSVALEDFTSGVRNPIKSPISSFTKRPKVITTMDSIGPSYSNNSPKTPLLSQFSKEDSKADRQMESAFNDEKSTGSYNYVVCHPQSPESDNPPNSSTGISKQPATSNVIRNPAMMMGSRLNPYRNIPPPII